MAIRVSWGHMEPHFWGRGGRKGSAMAPFETATAVSYRLSIVTVALSVTIRPQFAIECLPRSNQQGVGDFGPKVPVASLEVDPRASDSTCSTAARVTSFRHSFIMFGSAESERPTLTNREIIFEEFQPM